MLLTSQSISNMVRDRLSQPVVTIPANDDFNAGWEAGCRAILIDLEKIMEKERGELSPPYVQISQIEKVVVLHCDDALFKVVNDLDSKKNEQFGLMEMGKLWNQMKKILDKGIQKDSTSTGGK